VLSGIETNVVFILKAKKALVLVGNFDQSFWILFQKLRFSLCGPVTPCARGTLLVAFGAETIYMKGG
jgi:hypothetical protein